MSETRPEGHSDRPFPRATGRTLVTGGAVRVGRAVALGLARAGWDVDVHYHRSEEAAGDTADRIRGAGREAVTARADLRDVGTIPGLGERVAGGLGGLDLLVNSAAVFLRARPEEVKPGGGTTSSPSTPGRPSSAPSRRGTAWGRRAAR